jgi:hypothetical protein
VLVRRKLAAPHPLAWAHFCTLEYCDAPGRWGSGFWSMELAVASGLEHLRVWHRPEPCDGTCLAPRAAWREWRDAHVWTAQYGWVHPGRWVASYRASTERRWREDRNDYLLRAW